MNFYEELTADISLCGAHCEDSVCDNDYCSDEADADEH